MSATRKVVMPGGGTAWVVAADAAHLDALEARLTSGQRLAVPVLFTGRGPTLRQMAWHLATAVGRILVALVLRQPVRVSLATSARRWLICRRCPYLRPSARWGLGMCAHGKCGCTIRRMKIRLATEKCPRGKWGASGQPA